MTTLSELRSSRPAPVERGRRQLPGLDAGRLRLLPDGLHVQRHRQGLPRRPAGGGGGQHADPGRPAVRGAGLRHDGRPLWPPAGADDQRAALFGAGADLGFRADPGGAAGAARPVRLRHGRGLGRGRLAGAGVIPPKARGSSRACCRKAMRPATCWPRRSSSSCSTASAGAACSWSASCRRSWWCSSSSRCANCRPSRPKHGRRHGRSPPFLFAAALLALAIAVGPAVVGPMLKAPILTLDLRHRRAAGADRPVVLPPALEDGACVAP